MGRGVAGGKRAPSAGAVGEHAASKAARNSPKSTAESRPAHAWGLNECKSALPSGRAGVGPNGRHGLLG
eukprot:9291426-Lingulodinium_polyedra.AAC.1